MTPPSFLESLDPGARELLLSVARPVSFVPGALLVRQGEPARGAYVIREGTVDAVVTLPGGESLTVATLQAGSIFGEMALVDLGTCTASIRATSPVDGWYVAHEDFRALASQGQPDAIRLQHAVTTILAGRIAALNAQLLQAAAPEDRPARAAIAKSDPLAGVARTRKPSFACAAFLPRLPLFEHFAPEEIDEVVACASYVEVPRGHGVFSAGTPAAAAFLVVRGAVEIIAIREPFERRIAILGPGQLVGYLSVLRGASHSTHAFAREGSTLLELPASDFHAFYFGTSRASARLRQAVQASLLVSMARTNRGLGRLVSLARLSASREEERVLEAARAAQVATASPL
jgi:CRP/FNR family cyclic AMP-dependent transcriptional regulator